MGFRGDVGGGRREREREQNKGGGGNTSWAGHCQEQAASIMVGCVCV